MSAIARCQSVYPRTWTKTFKTKEQTQPGRHVTCGSRLAMSRDVWGEWVFTQETFDQPEKWTKQPTIFGGMVRPIFENVPPYLFNWELVLMVANEHSFLVLHPQIKQTRMFIDPGLILHICVCISHTQSFIWFWEIRFRKTKNAWVSERFLQLHPTKNYIPIWT